MDKLKQIAIDDRTILDVLIENDKLHAELESLRADDELSSKNWKTG